MHLKKSKRQKFHEVKDLSQTDYPVIPNSEAEYDGFSSVVYTCAHGYFRRGNSYISTFDRDTRTWSAVDMTCTFVDCRAPPELHGAQARGIGTTANSEVIYSCLAGAVPNLAEIKVVCEGSTGQWSSLEGTCSAVTCGQPPAVDKMDTEMTSRSSVYAFPSLDAEELKMAFGAQAKYTCKPGYVPLGEVSYISECEADGAWSSTENFVCSPVECGQPPHPPNVSHMSYTATTFGENATAFCLPGFYPLTGLAMTCGETGSWVGNGVTCDLINCGTPPPVDNAVAHYVATSLKAEAKYECQDEAAVQEGSNSTSTCQENGEWSPPSIQCLAVPCGSAPSVPNSSVTYKLTDEREFDAVYTCDNGYVFFSSSTKLLCDLRNNIWRFDGDNNIKCVGISCGAAPSVNHSIVVESGRNFPAQASYTCDAGYMLSSSVSIKTCNEDGSWSTDDVTCDRAMCSTPTPPRYAVLSQGVTLQERYDHGDNVTFICQDGHLAAPASSLDSPRMSNGNLTCLDGNWTIIEPDVLCIACNIPPVVTYATWEIPKEQPTRVVYTCDAGYNITRDNINTLDCLETESPGVWFGNGEVRCERVDCGNPPLTDNGTVSTEGTKYNDTATYTCNFGYRAAAGDSERKCSSHGTWSGSELECEVWNCEPPPDVANSTVHYTSLTFNSTALYTCDAGLGFLQLFSRENVPGTFLKSIGVVCSDERIWINGLTQEPMEMFACVQIQCPSAPIIPNTRMVNVSDGPISVNTAIHYECVDGYKHLGLVPKLICTDDGTWSFPFFECLRINCGQPPPINHAVVSFENGTTVGSKAIYTCDMSFEHVSNQKTRTCESDGLWSHEFIECVPNGQKHCGDPPPLAAATVEVHSSHNEWTALYTCAEGYQHSWSNTLHCYSPLFYWIAAPVIECVLECGNLQPVEHADVFYGETTVGRVVVHLCHDGYVPTAETTKTCTAEGSWPTEPVLECIIQGTVTCGPPPQIMNSNRVYISITEGSLATYTCDHGFTGPLFQAVCGADGQWTLQSPSSCLLVTCGTVPTVQNSATSYLSGTTYGDVVVYKCLEGYKPSGSSLKTCEANGLWSSDIVECVPKSWAICGNPPKRDHTSVRYESRAEGARATYSCVAPYVGDEINSHCGMDGQWSGPSLICELINCKIPTAIRNSEIALTPRNNPVGRTVVHSCNPGFTSSTGAPLISTCMKDGTWSSPEGACEAVNIEDFKICSTTFPLVSHGNPVLSNHLERHVGATLKYVCDAGYFPLPSSDNFAHTCLSNVRWSSSPLVCYPGLCLTISAPLLDNAEYSGLESQGSVAAGTFDSALVGMYKCLSGFTTDKRRPAADGSNTSPTVACSHSTGWADIPGDLSQGCMPVDCGYLELTEEYETTIASYNSMYMSQVEIACRSPWFQSIHDSVANKVVVCNANGEWSFEDTALLCAPCNQTIDLAHGTVEIHVAPGQQYGVEASVQCDTNYYLIGHHMVHCGSVNGSTKWKGLEKSRCVQNIWPSVEGNENFYKFNVYMDAVEKGFSACANVTYTRASKKLQLILKETSAEHGYTNALAVADDHEITFSYQKDDIAGGAEMITEETVDKILFNEGVEAYVCITLDTSSQTFAFVNNDIVEMTMPALRYENITRFNVGMAVTVHDAHILYNQVIGAT
ncbi:sushi, von Willebrand factor type A, EGF and pentraxin domain-containing protein 1 [Elysia marginata]|uniref:Sushi, von Willebrand factor type A, EGF and pentraxin domain-containing protein 1 n=1 Tax=Elysia marginata TaxID=1093978 RepID=A0AAV4ECE0_9GAST|nr:sushi, von Willebrand factor type A, EGF and pentraxin domain-containing protein 1 [Elysia marginata]